jgi:hypothetical protein
MTIADIYHTFVTVYDQDFQWISLLIHEFAELAFQEHQSSNVLVQFLECEGFTMKRGIAGDETAFVGSFKQGKGSVVSFNAVRFSLRSNIDLRNTMHFPVLDTPVDII